MRTANTLLDCAVAQAGLSSVERTYRKLYNAQRMKMALMTSADNTDPDQHAHPRRLILAYVVRLQNQWIR